MNLKDVKANITGTWEDIDNGSSYKFTGRALVHHGKPWDNYIVEEIIEEGSKNFYLKGEADKRLLIRLDKVETDEISLTWIDPIKAKCTLRKLL